MFAAALAVCFGTGYVASLVLGQKYFGESPALAGLIIAVSLFVVIAIVLILFNPSGSFHMLKALWSTLRSPGEEPVDPYRHPTLGDMDFSKDDEAWVVERDETRFLLTYTGKSEPSAIEAETFRALVEHRSALLDTITADKAMGIEDWAEYASEIAALTVESVSLSFRDNVPCKFVSFDGGKDFRFWRMEYEGDRCLGMGWDD